MNEKQEEYLTTLFRSIHKERYARQELIKKIEQETGRTLIVYVANLSHPGGIISRDDIAPFGDLLEGKENIGLDLLLQSPGGDIDKAEKIVYMCRNRSSSFRVIVPESAKSAATLIALAADSIIMGYTSELGPIDPQIVVTTPDGRTINRPAQSFLDGLEEIRRQIDEEGGLSPVYFPLLQQLDPALIDFCNKAVERSKSFAKKWLQRYMCIGDEAKAERIAEELANVKKYLSHGYVIDYEEARKIGLTVEYLPPSDTLWQALWRLYCTYEIDIRSKQLVKIFESADVSLSLS
jgi:ATP-dependent protease ClpP protease subunit